MKFRIPCQEKYLPIKTNCDMTHHNVSLGNGVVFFVVYYILPSSGNLFKKRKICLVATEKFALGWIF